MGVIHIQYLKNGKGQSMVEFCLTIIPFLIFVFGLITCCMWGTAAFLAQEASHEAARKYAVTLEEDKAQELGKAYLMRWGYIFIQPNNTEINLKKCSDGKTVQAEAVVRPRIITILAISMPEISRISNATLEDVFRNPGNYHP